MTKKVAKKSTPTKGVLKKSSPSTKIYIPGPEEYNKPPETFEEYILLIYGMKSIGKSTVASEAPGNFTLMSEPLRRGLRIRMGQLRTYSAKEIMEGAPDSYAMVKNTTVDIINNATIQKLTFDSIDLFYDMVVHSICASHGIASPGDAGKNSSNIWIEIRNEFKAYMDMLAESRLGIILLSHSKEREIDGVDGAPLSLVGPSCAPACLQYIKQAVDYGFFYGFHESKRVMVIRDPLNFVWTGCGPAGHFLQPDGKPIYKLEMPEMPGKGYKTLVDAFNNKCWDIDTPKEERTSRKALPVKRKVSR